ncbi:hypothetical protein VDGD_05157 [Verticillium dahliae]|nr:hypothetical protein VDGD_05157 [Verticillium dahliae]
MVTSEISRPFVELPQQYSRIQQVADWLYDTTRRRQPIRGLGTEVIHPTVDSAAVTVVYISDTHNTKLDLLPPGDILVHASDLSQFGTFDELQAQLSWLAALSYKYKIIIASNHDLLLDGVFVAARPNRELERHVGKRRGDLIWEDVRYLEHEALELEVKGRSVRVFGSPWTPRCGSWAFQYGPDATSPMRWLRSVPPRTDILLGHGPPRTHLDDGGKGCDQLLAVPGLNWLCLGIFMPREGWSGCDMTGHSYGMRLLRPEHGDGGCHWPGWPSLSSG